MKWCDEQKGRPVGDKELSQSFIHLALALLEDRGRAGLLVSSGVFFKHHPKSRKFREVWLTHATLKHVVNFAHVRKIFFSGPERETQGVSPFASVVFQKTKPDLSLDTTFQYWSAKRTAIVENTKAVVLNRGDMHWLSQRDCLADERLWKIFWWGGPPDLALIRRLDVFPRLRNIPDRLRGVSLKSGRGFEVTKSGKPSDWLTKYRELPSKSLVRYGSQPLTDLRAVPERVYRKGLRAIYSGRRLLVARGVKSGGVIVSRLETKQYCFRNSVHGVRFKGLETWQEAAITAVFWSSLARFYYFMTSGSWGFWHDEIHLDDVEQMPICFPSTPELRDRIINVVAKLEQIDLASSHSGLFQSADGDDLPSLEQELNSSVFDLYGLTEAERELVQDRCTLGLDLFYQHSNSSALEELPEPTERVGTLSDLTPTDGLPAYLRTFLGVWNNELLPDGEFAWRIVSPPSRAPLLAVCFRTQYKNGRSPILPADQSFEWADILAQLQASAVTAIGASRIYIDTFFRYINDREILFIKRNERRFWTPTTAREDAESALTHLMTLEEASGDGVEQ